MQLIFRDKSRRNSMLPAANNRKRVHRTICFAGLKNGKRKQTDRELRD